MRLLQTSSNPPSVNAIPVTVLMVCGVPIKVIFSFRNLVAVFSVRVSQMHAVGHLLYRYIDTRLKNRLCFNLIGPMRLKQISWFGFWVGGKTFFSVIDSFMLLPVILHGMQLSHFCLLSLPIFGHHNHNGCAAVVTL